MNITEVKRLLSFVSSVCPSQRINEGTPQAWLQLLRDVDYDSAYAAARTVGARETYVNVAAIIGEVRARKATRIPKPGEWGACPEHVGQWLTHCGPCRSERIAKADA